MRRSPKRCTRRIPKRCPFPQAVMLCFMFVPHFFPHVDTVYWPGRRLFFKHDMNVNATTISLAVWFAPLLGCFVFIARPQLLVRTYVNAQVFAPKLAASLCSGRSYPVIVSANLRWCGWFAEGWSISATARSPSRSWKRKFS